MRYLSDSILQAYYSYRLGIFARECTDTCWLGSQGSSNISNASVFHSVGDGKPRISVTIYEISPDDANRDNSPGFELGIFRRTRNAVDEQSPDFFADETASH